MLLYLKLIYIKVCAALLTNVHYFDMPCIKMLRKKHIYVCIQHCGKRTYQGCTSDKDTGDHANRANICTDVLQY